MKRKTINLGWSFSKGTVTMMDLFMGGSDIKNVDLPHDAMIYEDRDPNTPNSHHTGFYPGGQYTYIKRLDVPQDWAGRAVTLEFEGVAGLSRVYINGDYSGGNCNSYTGFYVSAESFLLYGEANEIKVEVNCPEQASRWYSGAGIYRDVHILVGGPIHFAEDGLRITTPEVNRDLSTVLIETEIRNRGNTNQKITLSAEILNKNGTVVASDCIPVTLFANNQVVSRQRIAVENPQLWDDETPNLYTCIVKALNGDIELDDCKSIFGIRSLTLSAQKGLCVNGRNVKLRGACIHHDNGILGAATFETAETRRCEQLRAAGFNSLRSSHHPMSRAMLDACDQLGIYIIDELSDMWTRTKTPNDYAVYFPDHWEQDLESMIRKDYNHPSVIMYSLGNEIQEAGTARGAEWCRRINNRVKQLDPSRYTVNGINGIIAGSARMGEIMQQITGMTMEQMAAAQQAPSTDDENSSGADKPNGMMSIMTGPIADGFSKSPILYDMIDEYTSGTDVAGYNYLTALHLEEKTLHPGRVVLGAETFPADIVALWGIVKNNPHVLGDMTWAGYDYIGEAGCGIFHYDGTQNFVSNWPDRLAGIGDIDILGNRKPISYLREIVYGLRKEPYIAVMRMNRNGQKSSQTPWMWKDNIASWTWPGYEGQAASVDVYSDAEEVELLLNSRIIGRKSIVSFSATFDVPYSPGVITAISYCNGVETGRFMLATADNDIMLQVISDKQLLKANGTDLAFVTILLTDGDGRLNSFAHKDVTVTVEGCAVLQGFGSAIPSGGGKYQDNTWQTYDGIVMAVLRAGTESGTVIITAMAEECKKQCLTIQIGK